MNRTIRLTVLTALTAGALALPPAAANGALTVSPSSLSFSQPVGTTSAPQAATLKLTCDGCAVFELFNPVVAATPAAFTQTNDCVGGLSVFFVGMTEDSCKIDVAFAANTAGVISGTLSTGMGGPTVSLSGTGVAPPTVAPAPPASGTKGKCKKGKKKPTGASVAKRKKCGKKKRGK